MTDIKALHYIYQVSGYNFAKELGRREVTRSIGGRGILWADGNILSSAEPNNKLTDY